MPSISTKHARMEASIVLMEADLLESNPTLGGGSGNLSRGSMLMVGSMTSSLSGTVYSGNQLLRRHLSCILRALDITSASADTVRDKGWWGGCMVGGGRGGVYRRGGGERERAI